MIDVLGYHRPATYAELWEMIESTEPPLLVCAGCTDLIVKSRAGVLKPATWLDLRRLAPLQGITIEKDRVILGACSTHHQVANNELIQKEFQALAHACSVLGSRQIRSRGTLGGNAANASPCADSKLALIALDAEVILRSKAGSRQIPIADLAPGPGETCLDFGEIIESFVLTRVADRRSSFLKIGPRRAVTVAKVSASASAVVASGHLHQVRLVMGSVAPIQMRVPRAESILEGKAPDEPLLDLIASVVEATVKPIDDVRSTAAYRRTTSGVLAQRAIKALLAT